MRTSLRQSPSRADPRPRVRRSVDLRRSRIVHRRLPPHPLSIMHTRALPCGLQTSLIPACVQADSAAYLPFCVFRALCARAEAAFWGSLPSPSSSPSLGCVCRGGSAGRSVLLMCEREHSETRSRL
jgi:hypothetical protein